MEYNYLKFQEMQLATLVASYHMLCDEQHPWQYGFHALENA
jgi:hypothetical protein